MLLLNCQQSNLFHYLYGFNCWCLLRVTAYNLQTQEIPGKTSSIIHGQQVEKYQAQRTKVVFLQTVSPTNFWPMAEHFRDKYKNLPEWLAGHKQVSMATSATLLPQKMRRARRPSCSLSRRRSNRKYSIRHHARSGGDLLQDWYILL